MDSDEIQLRARRAEALLSDELLVEAFNAIEQQAMARWRVSEDIDAREDAWRSIRAVDALRAQLMAVVDADKVQQAKVPRLRAWLTGN